MTLYFHRCENCGSVNDVTLEEYKGNPNNLIYLCKNCRKTEGSAE